MNNKRYNGLIIFGEMCTGKDTLADYLIELDNRCCKYNIGNVIRQFLSIVKVNPEFKGKDRLLGQTIADKLREVHPQILNDYCLSRIYEKWQDEFNFDNSKVSIEDFNNILMQQLALIRQKEIPIIVGGRTKVDFEYWSGKNFLTIGILCENNIRLERLRERDGIAVAKNSNFKHNTEVNVGDIARNQCEYLVDNSFDFNHLKSEAGKLLNTL